ncbi:hypothetical protein IWX46DRAFT_669073 [Phyllosticta citricarpa]|uniref:Uncharacterized protein n=1 Tax=Phyllosticta citricarpa TaxID=55181 RepID=A0ABR1MKZ5_9PEZI
MHACQVVSGRATSRAPTPTSPKRPPFPFPPDGEPPAVSPTQPSPAQSVTAHHHYRDCCQCTLQRNPPLIVHPPTVFNTHASSILYPSIHPSTPPRLHKRIHQPINPSIPCLPTPPTSPQPRPIQQPRRDPEEKFCTQEKKESSAPRPARLACTPVPHRPAAHVGKQPPTPCMPPPTVPVRASKQASKQASKPRQRHMYVRHATPRHATTTTTSGLLLLCCSPSCVRCGGRSVTYPLAESARLSLLTGRRSFLGFVPHDALDVLVVRCVYVQMYVECGCRSLRNGESVCVWVDE